MATAKKAIVQALLNGHTLNVKNCFHLFGITNCAREMSRMIEKEFEVKLIRTQVKGRTRYGRTCTWYDYHLDLTDSNAQGLKDMADWLTSQEVSPRRRADSSSQKVEAKLKNKTS